MDFSDLRITVPEPAAFVIQKFLISQRRKSKSKKEKDLKIATELGLFLFTKDSQKELLKRVFADLLPKWQKKLITILKSHSNEFYRQINEIIELK